MVPLRRLSRRSVERSLRPTLSAALTCGMLFATSAVALPSDEEELAQAYGPAAFVSIATGSRVPVSRAPSVATVITAEEIAAMGATDLDEVLEAVPGLHVARQTQGFGPVYVIRGINLGFNPQVLLLVNGVPVTSVFTGNRGGVWGGFPLENVIRIEVIRGPGSALYGADAFAGVINVITRTATEIDGTQVGLRAGSFSSWDGWLLHGGEWAGLEVAAYLRVGATDGDRSIIAADAQTELDRRLGTQASQAPGPISNQRDYLDAAVDLSRGKWRWRMSLRERGRFGSGTGVASALDPFSRGYSQNIGSDLSYDDPDFARDWSLSVQTSWMHYKEITHATLFPAGANLGGGVFADGVLGRPDKWERHLRFSASAFYTGWAGHRIRLGLGAVRAEVYKVRESRNYQITSSGLSPLGSGSLADVVDVTDTAPFMQPQQRGQVYAYVQDEWTLAKDWTLTAGLRHDRYDDFGSTTNPRAALVWEAAYDLTAKILFGTAFRAPSFSELYAINNPVVQGNPDLRPERIRTLEAALNWQPLSGLQLGANVFRYRVTDIIRLVDFRYQNAGTQTGAGLEAEFVWSPSKDWRLSGNYSYQRARDGLSGEDAGNSPHHHLYLRADWRLTGSWWLHTQVNRVGERVRVAADTREPLAGYTTMDVGLRAPQAGKGWSWAVSVHNLFDADAREPTPYDVSAVQDFISLPGDFPLPGRTWRVQASYSF